MSNGSPVPRISCPEPGIVRFEGEYDAVHINCSASYPLDFKFNGTKKFQLRSYTVKIEHVQKDINHEIRFENGTLDYVAGIYCGNRDRSKKATFGRTLTGIVYPFKYGHDISCTWKPSRPWRANI
ncbi:unnamed protein product [Allacma fusca]|uniref:Uncharacterized protein n=1 Tax=Allacma fusca TaxID=39272 RepID=A0A8J2P300_9HEXA|nr:unnamed protein product [Allacma fusca]